MKKKKITGRDGEEFTVFYLGANPNEPNKEDDKESQDDLAPLPISEDLLEPNAWTNIDPTLGVSGCCPIGPEGEIGEQGIPPNPLGCLPPIPHHPMCPDSAPEEKEAFVAKIMNKLKSWTDKPPQTSCGLDDSIESDVVHDPVAGRIYKVKGLNIIARYNSTSEVGLYVMSFHGNKFLIAIEDGLLLKANPYDVEAYLSRTL